MDFLFGQTLERKMRRFSYRSTLLCDVVINLIHLIWDGSFLHLSCSVLVWRKAPWKHISALSDLYDNRGDESCRSGIWGCEVIPDDLSQFLMIYFFVFFRSFTCRNWYSWDFKCIKRPTRTPVGGIGMYFYIIDIWWISFSYVLYIIRLYSVWNPAFILLKDEFSFQVRVMVHLVQ